MKKFLSILLAAVMLASVMPGAVLAAGSWNAASTVYTNIAVPGTDTLLSRSSGKVSVTTDNDGSEDYYLYTILGDKTIYDAPLEYYDGLSLISEMTFMLSDGATISYYPVFYDPNKSGGAGFNWSSILTVTKNGGVVISNIADGTNERLFVENDVRWSNNKLTLIPYVTSNEKHTIRLEHDPQNAKFTLYFDSNKITIAENTASAWVEATLASSDIRHSTDGQVSGPRFALGGAVGTTLKVYKFYIRGSKDSTSVTANDASEVFSDALEYKSENDSADNLFSYYVDANDNAVITGFKYGVNPSSEDNVYTKSNPLVFPSSINGHTVTDIANLAFNENASGKKTKTSSEYARWSNITDIKLPDTLKTIGQYSMVCFKQLGSLTLPDSVETVDNYAFSYIDQLTALDLGNSLKTIGVGAFSYLGKSNFELIVPESVETINNQAFTNSKMSTVIFEGAPSTVGTYMFRNNPALNKVVFLKDMNLGDCFFGGNKTGALNRVTVENKFTIIGSSAMLTTVKTNMTEAEFSEQDFSDNISYEDIFVYKSADVPSVYYWGEDKNATLIKAEYNKTTKALESCELVPMTAGNSYALELADESYDVKNFVWSMGDCKPLNKAVNY